MFDRASLTYRDPTPDRQGYWGIITLRRTAGSIVDICVLGPIAGGAYLLLTLPLKSTNLRMDGQPFSTGLEQMIGTP